MNESMMYTLDSLINNLDTSLRGIQVFNRRECIIGDYYSIKRGVFNDIIEIQFLAKEEKKYWTQSFTSRYLVTLGVDKVMKELCRDNKLLDKPLFRLALGLNRS